MKRPSGLLYPAQVLLLHALTELVGAGQERVNRVHTGIQRVWCKNPRGPNNASMQGQLVKGDPRALGIIGSFGGHIWVEDGT